MGGLTGENEISEDSLEEEALFLATSKGKVKAFIHVGLKKYKDDDEDSEEERTGYIRFFGYERGEWQAGQALDII